ncbi:MAG TPA: hypothetical protein VGC96_10730 [Candidatus Elarobacter sp.]|jgi:hypothetical protein
MTHRALSALAIATLSVSLAACGGGGTTNTVVVQPPSTNPGSITIIPSSLSFTGPGAAAQAFTVSSTAGAVAAPSFNNMGCAPVVSIATANATLPATYTVTPIGNGSCSLIVNLGHASATIGINVGTSPTPVNTSTSTVTLFVGGTAGSVLVGSTSGTFTADTTACSGIATITGSGFVGSPQYNQQFTITPVSAGTCQLPLVNGSSSVVVTITVNPSPSGPSALQISPSSMDFASTAAPPQHATINFTGSVGNVSFNEDDCIGLTGKPKIAFFTLDNVPPGTPVSLPASITVTLYGTATGSCIIRFIPQNGSEADLTVTVH